MKRNIIIWSIVGTLILTGIIVGLALHNKSGRAEVRNFNLEWASHYCPPFQISVDPSFPSWALPEANRAIQNFNSDIGFPIYQKKGIPVRVFPQSRMTKQMRENCATPHAGSMGALGYAQPLPDDNRPTSVDIYICTDSIKSACHDTVNPLANYMCKSMYMIVTHEMIHPLLGPNHLEHGGVYSPRPNTPIMSTFLKQIASDIARHCRLKAHR